MLFWGHYITLTVTFRTSGDFNCSLGRTPPLAPFLGQNEPPLSYPGKGFGAFLAGCGSLSACWGHESGQTGGDDMLGCLTAVLGGHTHTNPTDTRVHEGHDSVSGHQTTKKRHETAQPQPNHSTTQHETTQQQNTNNKAVKG